MLFVSKYENGGSSSGGMVRVKDMEKLLTGCKCEFLTIDLSSPFSYHENLNENGNNVIKAGWLRFLKIYALLKAHHTIYFHSVGNFIKFFPFLVLSIGKTKMLDLHGAQPEEFYYRGQKIRSKIFGFFERIAFSVCDAFIHVSQNMIDHFQAKYPLEKRHDFYVPIFSSIINFEEPPNVYRCQSEARRVLGIDDKVPVFLYSGGIQEWQKPAEVCEFIRDVIRLGFSAIILSMQKDFFESMLIEHLGNERLIIRSVKPSDLDVYYKAANFGIMFRDEDILNRVASPTKMTEYLYYGMIPILKSRNVGDFVNLGIESLLAEESLVEPAPRKSSHNQKILCDILSNSGKYELKKFVMSLD